MMGETVTVYTYKEGAVDEMGEPAKEWSAQTVENVLVRPMLSDESAEKVDELHIDGIRAEYTLAFPKTAASVTQGLRGARVSLTGRGQKEDATDAFSVIGAPDITDPCPTQWNALVLIGRVYG